MKKISFLIKFICFNLVLFVILSGLDFVMRNKELEGAQDNFAKWKPEHADIVFVGSSHQFCSVDTELLFYKYGIESYMLSTSAQTVPMSYYAAKEAIELASPDAICFEVSYVANDIRTLEGMDHCFFDGFPNCKARYEALADLIEPEDRIYFLLPLGLFHSRWKELTEADFEGFPVTERGTYRKYDLYTNSDIPVLDESETAPIPEEMERYLDMMVDLCEEEGVRLILYTAPFNGLYPGDEGCTEDLYQRQRIFNQVGVYAAERGVEYYNLFHAIDELGIDNATDWADSQHFNVNGQFKMTDYLAENILIRR